MGTSIGRIAGFAAVFVAGVAVGVAVSRNGKDLREICVKSIGGLMALKDKAMTQAEIIKESAEDMIAESKAARRGNENNA